MNGITATTLTESATASNDDSSEQQAGAQEVVPKPNPAPDEAFHSSVLPFLTTHCTDCHGETEPEAGLSFHDLKQPAEVTNNRQRWEKVLALLRIEAMPPPDHEPQPSTDKRQSVIDWLDAKLFHVDCDLPNDSGRVTIRRLNRIEYSNTVRDLVGVDVDPARDFPSDDVGNGFDNIGDVLTLPPLLLEKYMAAAEQISAAAIVPGDLAKQREERGSDSFKLTGSAQSGPAGFTQINSSGSVIAEFPVRLDGDYTVHVEAAADQAGDELAKVELRVDGRAVKVFEVTGYRKPDFYSFDLSLSRGDHRVEAAFINDFYNPGAENPRERDRNLAVRQIDLEGPRNAQLPESHQQIITVNPSATVTPEQASRQIIARLLPRAFRRPVDEQETERFVRLTNLVRQQGDSFERSIQVALQAILVSPHFLFRVEIDAEPDNPDYARDINPFELASRLSYFLWSSMPDDELFALAVSGRLADEDVLENQVRRMLADPRSEQLVLNFGGQWLNLRNLDTITPDPEQFESFTADLRSDMVEETLAYFRHVMREDRSILDFLTGRYTFLNERLARHYGIDGVRGDELRRVELPAGQRAGVLTHASILTLTSNPTRTSPVKRGKWILENILGTPPPPAPPNVPELEETVAANPDASLREQLELHRKDPGCASCHRIMDAIGFGFENFDAIGRWRDKDGEFAIDSSGELPGGERFDGPVQLVDVLSQRKRDFCRSFAEKMLTYATGRGLEYYDRCALDQIVDEAERTGFRFSTLVLTTIQSRPFLARRGETGAKE